jgi:S-adenosylmethionine synthetase
MARFVAMNIVAAGLARACQIEVAYAIGVGSPRFHPGGYPRHGVVSDERIAEIVKDLFDFPSGPHHLQAGSLLRPIYLQTAALRSFRPGGLWSFRGRSWIWWMR